MQQGEGGHPPPMQQDTYIVQFPREQVYYVPPPENALFLQRHRNPPKASNYKCCPPSLIFALILLFIVAILGIAITTLCFLYKPTQPSFSVANFAVMNPPGHKSSSRPVYEISLTANNPNTRSGLQYDGDASVSLILNQTAVATGKFPGLEQDPDASTKVKVELLGKSTINGNRTERPITFDLEMRIGVKSKAGGLNLWSMECNVACKFKVSKLGNDTRVLSQECNTLS